MVGRRVSCVLAAAFVGAFCGRSSDAEANPPSRMTPTIIEQRPIGRLFVPVEVDGIVQYRQQSERPQKVRGSALPRGAGCSYFDPPAVSCGNCVFRNAGVEDAQGLDAAQWPSASTTAVSDLVTFASTTTERSICRFETFLAGTGTNASITTIDFTLRFYDGVPCQGTPNLLAEGTATIDNDGVNIYGVSFDIDPPVIMSNTVYLEMTQPAGTQAVFGFGGSIGNVAGDIGTADDTFCVAGFQGNPCNCNIWYGVPSSFWLFIEAQASENKPCCNLLTGQCAMAQPASCGGQLQRFDVTATACGEVPCTACGDVVPSGTPEGEASGCAQNDATNGGCNSVPEVYGAITCGQTISGTSGTFLILADQAHDTDWYRFTLAQPTQVSVRLEAEFNSIVFLATAAPDCDNIVDYVVETGRPCEPINTAPRCMPAGTHLLIVTTNDFSGVDCGRQYKVTLNCTGSPCTEPSGACCNTDGSCSSSLLLACTQAGGTFQGDSSSCATTECPEPPPNDLCANATQVIEGEFAFDSTNAATDGPNTPANCDFDGNPVFESDIWFCYTASCSGTATISLCGSEYDTKIAVYNGCTCPVGATPLACNDDNEDLCGVDALQSGVTIQATAGSRYMIRVGGYAGDQGPGTLTITCPQAPCTCKGDFNSSGRVDAADIAGFATALAGGTNTCADINNDNARNGMDIPAFITLVQANTGTGTPCGGGSNSITRCDDDATCPDAPTTFCLYQVQSAAVEGQPPCVGNGLNAFETICLTCAGSGTAACPGNAGAPPNVALTWTEQNCSFQGFLLQEDPCVRCSDFGPGLKRFRAAP